LRAKGKQETDSAFVDIFDLNLKKLVLKLKVAPSETEKENGAVQKKPPTPVEITSLAFSPDGKTIAIGNSIGQVRLYDAATGVFAFTLDGARAAAFGTSRPGPAAPKPSATGPSEAKPVVPSDKEAESKNATAIAIKAIKSLAFSSDGTTLAAIGMVLEEVPQGDVAIGNQSATARLKSGRVLTWDLTDRTPMRNVVQHDAVQQLAFVPHHKGSLGKSAWALATLVQSSNRTDVGEVILWKLEDGSEVANLTVGHDETITSFAFPANGGVVAVESNQKQGRNVIGLQAELKLYPLGSRYGWRVLEPDGVQVLGLTSDGKGIIILSASQALRILDAATGKTSEEYQLLNIRKGGKWNQGVVLPRGNLVALNGVDQEGRATIDLIDLEACPDLSGKWIDEAKSENASSIRKVANSKTEILVTSDFGTEERLTWSPVAKRYEGSGQLTGGERYRIFVTPIPGSQKLAVAWSFDEAWREKWFQHKAPRFPQITPELLQSLQKEYDEQFQRVWVQEKPGANRKPPFDPLVEQPW